MQRFTAIGRVGSEPEMRFTPQGKAVCSFSFAIPTGFGDNKSTMWMRITAWDKQAEIVKQYAVKGKQLYIEGRFAHDEKGQPKMFTKKDGTTGAAFELTLEAMTLLGDRTDGNNAAPVQQVKQPANGQPVDVTDIPF